MNADLDRALAPAKRTAAGLVLAAAALWLASGLYVVRPEQRGVVRRFGQVVDDGVMPGMHYHWPWPFEVVERPAVTEVRSLGVAFGFGADGAARPELEEGRESLLSGDENVVLAAVLVQYTIKSPRQWLYASRAPVALLERAVHEACVSRIAQRSVDAILTTGRQALQADLKEEIQRRADAWGLGVRLTGVQLQRVEPPAKVAEAFKEVGAAREDKQKLMQEAEGDRNRRLPEARAAAGRMRSEAESYAGERVSFARGDAGRFLAAREEYQKAKTVTARRLYLETVEEVLGRVRKVIVNPEAERNVRLAAP